MGQPLRVGIVGLGVISAQYLATLARVDPAVVRITAVADLDRPRAEAVGAGLGVAALDVDALLASDEVDVVLNLTIPAAHADVALRAIAAGKHVYGEKPLALDAASGREVLAAAAAAGVRVGAAPDTVLGTGIQTARALLDSGAIGTPVGASVSWGAPGHELWHPAPDFYYQPGGGPLLDMGPYYVTALVTLLGPAVRVSASAHASDRRRVVAQGPDAGREVPVDVATHVVGVIEHASGAVSSVTMSFDTWASRMSGFEVYGTAGTIAVPDPNRFSDPVELAIADDREWRIAPDSAGYRDAGRGIGLVDLAAALASEVEARATGELALHVLEIMEGMLVAAREGRAVEIAGAIARPAAVPLTDALAGLSAEALE